MSETFDQVVERIAKAWMEKPCGEPACNPDCHVWETAHPDDKDYARDSVAFVMKELGFG